MPGNNTVIKDLILSTFLQLQHLENRRNVHKDAVNFCQNILRHKPVEWKALLRKDLRQPIRDVDLVITVGGDGTLLHASHYIDDSVPVLGVNSDPTQPEEVSLLFALSHSVSLPLYSWFLVFYLTIALSQFIFFSSVLRILEESHKLFTVFDLVRWKSTGMSMMLPEAQAIFVLQLLTTLNR